MKVGDLVKAVSHRERFTYKINGYLLFVTDVLQMTEAPDAIEGRWVKSGRMMGWTPVDIFEVVSEGR